MKVKSSTHSHGTTVIRLDSSWSDIPIPLYDSVATIDGVKHDFEFFLPRGANPRFDSIAIQGELDIKPGAEITLS